MKEATLKIDRDYRVCEVDPRIYGSFVEHMGRVVYTGIYEPGHPAADANGIRQDVLKLVKELGLSVIRYPGGNYTSGYQWEDTVGPAEERPTTINLAWKALESNEFGLNEFMEWIGKTGAEPILTLNLGTRGIKDACNLVEYCNFEKGTYYSDLRRSHHVEKPYGVKLWCLGNELDGHWQIASKTAEEYGRLANETAKAIKWIDPAIETIAVGSSTPKMKSYPEWDRTVLMECYENVDYLSLHNYINRMQDENLAKPDGREPDDIGTYLSRAMAIGKQIDEIAAICDSVKAVKRSNKTMYLAFDEWNVHRHPEREYVKWQQASPIDWCHFDFADTLLFGGMLLNILRRADRVKIACQSLLVNTIPLILTEEGGKAWVNPTYYPYLQASHYGRGTLLQTVMKCETYDSKVFDEVPAVEHVVLLQDDVITVFALNRSNEDIQLHIDFSGFKPVEILEHSVLAGDLDAKNTAENPDNLVPLTMNHRSMIKQTGLSSTLSAYSWNMVRFKITQEGI